MGLATMGQWQSLSIVHAQEDIAFDMGSCVRVQENKPPKPPPCLPLLAPRRPPKKTPCSSAPTTPAYSSARHPARTPSPPSTTPTPTSSSLTRPCGAAAPPTSTAPCLRAARLTPSASTVAPASPSLQLQQGRRHRRAQARLLLALPGSLRLRLRQRRLPVPQLAGLPRRDGGPEDELLLVLPEGVRVAAAHAVALRDARERVLEDGGAAPF
ncbi:hypothetical protein Cni_G23309 [Canna indica]|uniref:Uncharacterized protein n=1 Tax=Canna indica TaxID=4628 RepID=A0AAQ3KTK2_9LILI|nr:hypothetical protein Cni_G23309 [Canna indica]